MKKVGIIKRRIAICLIFLMCINSFAAVVSDNDGSAFITKAEFDSLKNNFQTQIDSYNQSIDSKIDVAIASYLSGISINKTEDRSPLLAGLGTIYCLDLKNPDDLWKYARIGLDLRFSIVYFGAGNVGATSVTQYRKYIWSKIHTDASNSYQKNLINNLNASNTEADWVGLGQNGSETWLTYYNSTEMASEGTQASGVLPDYISPSNRWYFIKSTYGAEFVRESTTLHTTYYHYGPTVGPDPGYNSSRGLYLNHSIDYGNIVKTNAIVWQPDDYVYCFEPDKVGGFGLQKSNNAIPKHEDVFDGILTRYWYSNLANTKYEASDTIDIPLATSSQLLGGNVWPGQSPNPNCQSWKKLKNKNFGSYSNSTSSDGRPFLFEGLPFVNFKKDETAEWEIKFANTTKIYQIMLNTAPFSSSATSGNILISKDKISWANTLNVKSGDKVYFDFKTRNTLPGNEVTLFMKWHDTATGTNGGGDLILNANPITVTLPN